MKFFNILYIILGLCLVSYIYHHVRADNICETIYGCFALWLYIDYRDKNH